MADNGDVVDDELEGAEVLALKVEFDLVPDWSNVVEKIARQHGDRVVVGVDAGALIVKVAVQPAQKERLLADVARVWDEFVERRKREGRWSG